MDRSVEKIAELVPTVRDRAIYLINWTRGRGGLRTVVLEAYRSPQRQLQLLEQSTTGRVVTQTRNSLHTQGRAFDVAFVDDRVSVTYDVPDVWWQYLGRVGKAYGLRWGGDWVTLRDYGHFEL